MVILHASDCDDDDRWFRVELATLVEFKNRVAADGLVSAWSWLVDNAERCDTSVDHTLDEFFFDYRNPTESLAEWDEYLN